MSRREHRTLTSDAPAPRFSVARRKACVRALLLVAVGFAGCTTTAPLQTASTVDPGVYRLSGQVSAAAYCSTTLSPFTHCAYVPRDAPVPEVRFAARRGFTPWLDAGASLAAGGVIHRGLQLQGLVDAKAQLWTHARSETERHILSLGGGVGLSTQQAGLFGTGDRYSLNEVLLAVPLFYGFETKRLEVVVSPRFVEHVGLGTYSTSWVGASVGAFTQGKTRFGIGLDYFAPVSLLDQGWWTLSAGVLWDVGSGQPLGE